MPKWSKIAKGDHVVLKGSSFEVVKIKPKGDRVKVTVRGERGTFESTVAADAKVERAPLRDESGRMKRWATEREVKHRDPIPAGDPSVTKPPGKLSADPWETRRDKTERLLERALGAVLIGEATDEGAGYYVPPVDVSTIMGHWVTFHGGDPTDYEGEADTLVAHEAEHKGRLEHPGDYAPLKVNHWHTKTRPETTA